MFFKKARYGPGRLTDVIFRTTKINATESPERLDFEQVYRCSFFRFVSRDCRVCGRMDFQNVESIIFQQELAAAEPVDYVRLVVVDAGDGLA